MPIKIRVVLFLALLMLYPLSGVQYLRESEKNTRALESDYLKDRIIDIGQLITFSFNSVDSLNAHTDIVPHDVLDASLFFYPLSVPPQIDGYDDDEWTQIPHKAISDTINNFSLTVQSGAYGETLFLRIVVEDDTPQPHSFYRSLLANGDYFAIRLGNQKTYYFRLTSVGNINAYTLGRDDTLLNSTDISAAWQSSVEGYQIELSVSESIAAGRLGFFVVNGANAEKTSLEHHQGIVANLNTHFRQSGIYPVIEASSAPAYQFYQLGLANVLSGFVSSGMRLHVVDRQCNVIATAGQFAIQKDAPEVSWMMKALYQRVLASDAMETYAPNEVFDCDSQWSIRQSKGGLQLWSTAYTNDLISYAAMPLVEGPYAGNILIAEQSRNRYAMFTNRTFASYLYYTLGISLLIVLAISSYLFFWSWRLNRLNNLAKRHVDEMGDVSSGFKTSQSADEIGQLSRNVGSLLEKIRVHNDYLKTLAQKLSHEMKTPLAIVSTSLDNIDRNEANRVYVERAQEGMHRLSYIMSSMGQAKRLEQVIENTEFETVDIIMLLSEACDAYQNIYEHNIIFSNTTGEESVEIRAASELLIQMLDKLVDNAVDYSLKGTPIIVEVESAGDAVSISVLNQGPLLDESAIDTLFQQLVSYREKGSEKPHLGLGLFIARLIAEDHGGVIQAKNQQDRSGVCFSVRLPIKK